MHFLYEKGSLKHHGILGQKWGVRRFQNPDGTLTAAGKERRLTDSDSKKIYEQLKDKGRMTVSPYGAGYKTSFDYSNSDDIKEAGNFLKSQYDATMEKGKELQAAFQKEVELMAENPKEILDRAQEYYGEFQNSVPISYGFVEMDEELMEYVVAEVANEKFQKNNRDAINNYDQMKKTYDENFDRITKDLVGSFGDEKVNIFTGKRNLFGVKKKVKDKFERVMSSTLLDISGGDIWDFPNVDYYGNSYADIIDAVGEQYYTDRFEKICESITDKYNRRQ